MVGAALTPLGIPALPVPPGTSGFHVKGTVYTGVLDRLAREPPEAVARIRGELADPALLAFYDQLFLASGWYDVFPVIPLLSAVAREKSVSLDQIASEGARERVTEDIRTIYRSVFRGASPDQVASRLVRGLARYLDFGRAEGESAGTGATEIVTHGMPAFLVPWYVPASGTFIRVALESAGAREVRIAWRNPEPSGRRDEIALVSLRATASWR
jgi:hypothetical protein